MVIFKTISNLDTPFTNGYLKIDILNNLQPEKTIFDKSKGNIDSLV